MELKTEYIDNYTPVRPIREHRVKKSKKKPIMILVLLLWNIGLTIDSYNLHQSVDYISIPVEVEESEPKQQEVITEDLSSFKLQPVPEHLLK